MKKILATVLALTMIVGMSIVPTFAASAELGDTTINVTATYDKADSVQDTSVIVYNIDVEYESMSFSFTETANKLVWNPEKFDYSSVQEVTGGTWADSKTTADITITNRSNAELSIEASIANAGGFTVTGDDTCETAVGGDKDNPPTATLTVTAPATIADDVTATVTVTIA